MKRRKEPFKGLGSILDIMYGVLVPFFMYTISNKYFAHTGNISSFFSIQSIALISVLIFTIEDYTSVKIINGIRDYGSTDRFSLDMAIAFLFFFTFQAINYGKIEFLYFIGLIHFFRFFWGAILMFRKLVGMEFYDFLKLISWPNCILFSVCATLVILNQTLLKGLSFENSLKYYLIAYFAILFLFVVIIKFKDIVKAWLEGSKKNIPIRKEVGPILSKFTILIIMLLIIIVKAIINSLFHLVKDIISFIKGKVPPIF